MGEMRDYLKGVAMISFGLFCVGIIVILLAKIAVLVIGGPNG